jgi:lipoyl(octanoyl) transferase
MLVEDLGTMAYREAWRRQEEVHARVVAGDAERLLYVEHSPVITFGRRPGISRNLIASDEELGRLDVEVVQSDRGGDITFHGPGQMVVYPIVRLLDHRLSVGAYVHRLEDAVVAMLKEFGIEGHRDDAVGVWTRREGQVAKICAIGVRIRQGVSMHGIALNVSTDLSYFDLIVPCGLVGRPVTSLKQLLGEGAPAMEVVKARFHHHLERVL